MTVQVNQNASILLDEEIYYGGDMGLGGDMVGETSTGSSVMSSYPFVIGISAVTLTLSIILGILLAKKRIKKGFDLYED